MTLTAGATLQYGKYTIQTVLEQNEGGITYQALQVNSARTVVVQTLNLPEPPPANLDQFLATVRHHLSRLPNPQVSVLECFVESNLLFIVLQPREEGLDPDLRSWFSPLINLPSSPSTPALSSELPELTSVDAITSPEVPTSLPAPESNSSESNTSNGHKASSPQETTLQPVATTIQPPAPPSAPARDTAQNGRIQNEPAAIKRHSAGNSQTAPSIRRSTSQPKVTVLTASPAQKPKSKLWIPMALGLTSIAAGLAGAGFGWALRTQTHNSTNNPSLLSPILNNEQAFPPIEGWVGDDPVDLSTPLAIPEESDRFSRRSTGANRHSGQGSFSEEIPSVRSPIVPQAAVEEIPPASEQPVPLPDPLDPSEAAPSPYTPPEPPPSEFVPIPPKIKPDLTPPVANPPAEPPPPSVQAPAAPPNINGALSTPNVQPGVQ